jgi:hypothetical protein
MDQGFQSYIDSHKEAQKAQENWWMLVTGFDGINEVGQF